MKSLSKKLKVLNLLLVIASIVYEGETTQINYTRIKREDIDPNFYYLHREKLNFHPVGLRISEIKCLEYIRKVKHRKTNFQMGPDDNDVPILNEIGGRDALPGEFPHMGALGWRTRVNTWSFKCGCSLVSPKFSLTAAHCSAIPRDGIIVHEVPEIVRFGDTNLSDEFNSNFNRVDAYILRIIVHPEYTAPKKYYDIALVELESKLQFSRYLMPVCLWSKFNMKSLGSMATSTGWGVVDPATRKTSTILQAIEINIIDSNECNKLMEWSCNRLWCGLREHQLCAGKLAGGVDSCEGDSGGPLQVKINLDSLQGSSMHFLIGVTSFGIGCARPQQPGIYTRVSSFIDWIECVVWRSNNNKI